MSSFSPKSKCLNKTEKHAWILFVFWGHGLLRNLEFGTEHGVQTADYKLENRNNNNNIDFIFTILKKTFVARS